jgi:mxaJ protein
MCSSCLERVRAVLLAGLLGCVSSAWCGEPLRVCADPDNLPYSHRDGRGFELRIAELLADALHAPLQIRWQAQRRAFVRKSWRDAGCDVLLGVPSGTDGVLTTRPYYRSSYAIVTRTHDAAPLRGLDDPRLRELHIGVQLLGTDQATTPPGQLLARRGVVQRVHGFPIDGPTPAPQRMVEALADRAIDAALIWGPQAGWFAASAKIPLTVSPLRVSRAEPELPIQFDVALAVRPDRGDLRELLDAAMATQRSAIDAILARHHLPRIDRDEGVR